MSRRRLEEGVSTSSFSLRSITKTDSVDTKPASVSRTVRDPPALSAVLSFKFASLGAAAAERNAATKVSSRLPANFFQSSIKGATNTNSTMRLTAVVDDLTQRLRKAIDGKISLEQQINSVKKSLSSERKNVSVKLGELERENSKLRGSETKLRSELSQLVTTASLDREKFGDRVNAALEIDSIDASVLLVGAEARIDALAKREETLSALLISHENDIKVAALQATDAKSKVVVAEADLAALSARETTLSALLVSHESDISAAVLELAALNAAAEKAADEERVEVVKRESAMEKLNEEIGKAAARLLEAEQAVIALTRTNATVSGALRPVSKTTLKNKLVEISALCSSAQVGVPSHLSLDSPIDQAHNISSGTESPVDIMTNALIDDLQLNFKHASAAFAIATQAPRVENVGACEEGEGEGAVAGESMGEGTVAGESVGEGAVAGESVGEDAVAGAVSVAGGGEDVGAVAGDSEDVGAVAGTGGGEDVGAVAGAGGGGDVGAVAGGGEDVCVVEGDGQVK